MIRSLLAQAYFLYFGIKTWSRVFLPVDSAMPRCYSGLNDQSQCASGPHVLTASKSNMRQIARLWMRYGRHGFTWDGNPTKQRSTNLSHSSRDLDLYRERCVSQRT